MRHEKVTMDTPEQQVLAQRLIKQATKILRTPKGVENARTYQKNLIGLCAAIALASSTVLGSSSADGYDEKRPVRRAVQGAMEAYMPNTKYSRTHNYWWPRTSYGTKRRLSVLARLAKQFATKKA